MRSHVEQQPYGGDLTALRKQREISKARKKERTNMYHIIQSNKYRPLSDVRKSDLTRNAKRIITYIKYKAMGILKDPKGKIKFKYTAPSPPPFEVPLGQYIYTSKYNGASVSLKVVPLSQPVNEIEKLKNDVQIIKDMSADPQVLNRWDLRPEFKSRALSMLGNYKQLGYNAVAVLTEMGAELPCNSYEEIYKVCSLRALDHPVLRFTKLLNGGNPGQKNNKKRRKKKRHIKKNSRQALVVGTQLGVRNPRNMLNNSVVIQDYWRYEEIFSTDGSGNLSVFLSLRNPLTAMNGSGVYQRAQDFAKLYDEFKVLSVGITVDFLYLNPQVGDIGVAVDYDTIPTGTYTYNDLRDNQYLKIFSGTNQISYMVKVPKLSEGTYRGQPAVIHQGGFYDFNAPPEEGAIVLAFERYTPGVRLVRITSSVKALMRRRRTLPTAEERKK